MVSQTGIESHPCDAVFQIGNCARSPFVAFFVVLGATDFVAFLDAARAARLQTSVRQDFATISTGIAWM